ncbi:metallophosphoesterase [Oryzifoliimicrobium ureilyticus]|uniref:metallophosphoesterase n=1 Tax=Oryzifoliimicrobium ureilyticus TaxID=3113724 RepID=UPI003076685D
MIIAQVSDIHANPSGGEIARFSRAVDWLCQTKPDLVVLSGDLVDEGWNEGYRLIGTIAAKLPCEVVCMPGNADDKRQVALLSAGNGWQKHGAGFNIAKTVGEALIVCLDTCVDTHAHGDLTPHLAWLRSTLDGDLEGTPLIFTHHHLFPCGIDRLDDAICLGIDRLKLLMRETARRPLAFCSGHVHQTMTSCVEGIQAYICGSICHANPLLWSEVQNTPSIDPPMLMMYRLQDQNLVSAAIAV